MAHTSGRQLLNCNQCGVCSGSCTVARFNSEFDPQWIIKKVLLGQDDILLSEIPWYCSNCLLCSERCPEEVNPAGVILSLQYLALRNEKGVEKQLGRGEKHVKAIVQSIERYGSLNEIAVIFKVNGYSPKVILNLARMGFSMLKRRKLPLPIIRSQRDPALKAIFSEFGGK